MVAESRQIDYVEMLAKNYAENRRMVKVRLENYREEVRKVRNRLLPGINSAARHASEAYEELLEVVSNSPELFTRPKTRTFFGIRVGWMKQAGKIRWSNKERVVQLIKKMFPDRPELLNVSESPAKSALQKLPATDLKRLGVEVTNDHDVPVAKSVDEDIDKAVAAILEAEEAQEVGE